MSQVGVIVAPLVADLHNAGHKCVKKEGPAYGPEYIMICRTFFLWKKNRKNE